MTPTSQPSSPLSPSKYFSPSKLLTNSLFVHPTKIFTLNTVNSLSQNLPSLGRLTHLPHQVAAWAAAVQFRHMALSPNVRAGMEGSGRGKGWQRHWEIKPGLESA